MRKLNWLLLFIFFIASGALFFAGGFLTCSALFPPTPAGLASNTSLGSFPDLSNGHTIGSSYAHRHAQIQSLGNNPVQNLLSQAEHRSENAGKDMTRSTVGRVLEGWSQRIRMALGPILGAVVVPMTTGLARSAVDATLSHDNFAQASPQTSPTMTQQIAGSTSPGEQKTETVIPGKDLYTIHVKDYSSMVDANDLVQRLKRNQFGAYVVRIAKPEGLIFSVRVGQFKGFTDAQTAASTLTQMWNDYPVRVMRIE